MDLTDVFVALGEAATERGRGVVLLLDEVQFLSKPQLEALIEALHKMVQRKLPITMVGAGLPQIAELAGDAKSYAERLFKFPAIANLPGRRQDRTRQAGRGRGRGILRRRIGRSSRHHRRLPYFIQELGYAVWTVAGGPIITRHDINPNNPDLTADVQTLKRNSTGSVTNRRLAGGGS